MRAGGAVELPFAFDLDLDLGENPEALGPQGHLVVHGVRADALEVAGGGARLLVRRQSGIDDDRGGRSEGCEGHRQENGTDQETLARHLALLSVLVIPAPMAGH